jgi:hypothetical protein
MEDNSEKCKVCNTQIFERDRRQHNGMQIANPNYKFSKTGIPTGQLIYAMSCCNFKNFDLDDFTADPLFSGCCHQKCLKEK